MNDLEANRILRRGRGITVDHSDTKVDEWISFFSSLNSSVRTIVTMGSEGAIAFQNGHMLASITPAINVDVIDPTGAGDAFTGE